MDKFLHVWLSYLSIIIFARDNQCCSVLLKVGQKAAIGHEGHDDIRGWSSIKTNSSECEHIWMIKLVHFGTFLEHFSYSSAVVET